MDIPYAVKSSFTAPCERQIIAQREALERGQVVIIQLPSKGFKRSLTVTIDPANIQTFDVAPAPDWFPSRIKAAAAALRDCGITGRFTVSHENGILTIQKWLESSRH